MFLFSNFKALCDSVCTIYLCSNQVNLLDLKYHDVTQCSKNGEKYVNNKCEYGQLVTSIFFLNASVPLLKVIAFEKKSTSPKNQYHFPKLHYFCELYSYRASCVVCHPLTFIGITWNKVSIKGFKEFLTLRKAEYLEHNSAEAFDISVRISFHVNKQLIKVVYTTLGKGRAPAKK